VTKKPLAGGVALVTGASRGIGRAIANQLALLGASVSICGRDRAALEDAAQEVAKTGVGVHFQIADVTKPPDIADLVAKTEAKLGPITILVNNAGIGLFGRHTKKPRPIGIACSAPISKCLPRFPRRTPSMIRRGAGDIINISSLAGKNTFAGGGIYCASKWGVLDFPAAWRKISGNMASASV